MTQDETPRNTNKENPQKTSKKAAGAGSKSKKSADTPMDDNMIETEQKLASAEQALTEAQDNLSEANDRLMRLAAEYENYRKRSQKETEAAFGNGVSYVIEQLLPVLDALDCAAQAETADEDYKKGVLMTLSKFEEVFEKLGVSEIDPLGEPFNPEFHNAVAQMTAEGAQSGEITQVIQKGYLYKDKVVRHAMVAVAP